jgi:hypothetical protein
MAGQAVGAGERLIDDGSVARIQERVAKVRGFFDGLRNPIDGLRNPIAAVGDEAAKTQQKIGEFKLGKVIPADLIDKAKKLKESLVSPAESFRIQTRELNQMLANGLINQRQFALASVRIAGELDKAINKGPDKGPEALISGSREAVSAILRFQRDGRKDDPLQRIAKTLEEAKRIEERTAKAAEDTARALKVLGNPVIVGI